MYRLRVSYMMLSQKVGVSKSTMWSKVNRKAATIEVEEFLLVCRFLELNPLDFIGRDEVQLKLL